MSQSSCWVNVPGTNREIDVAPLLVALTHFDNPDHSSLVVGLRTTITRVIRTLNVTAHDPQVTDPAHLADLYRDLHRLEDALAAMQERSMN